MADVNNYRRGETNPVVAKIITLQAVSLGDMVGISTDSVIRAGDEAYSNLSQAQFDFAQKFLGVATQRKTSSTASAGHGAGADNEIRVATEGVFEFDFPTTTTVYYPGQLVAPKKASGNALENQAVVVVSEGGRAIGVVEEIKPASFTKVKVRIFSTKILGAVLGKDVAITV